MRVLMQTLLAAPPERVWAEVNRSKLLHYVAWPLVAFQAVMPSALPTEWRLGEYEVKVNLFGKVLLGRQWIVISYPKASYPVRELLDNGRGTLIKRWRHRIRVEPHGDDSTRYTDDLDVQAGALTLFVWLYARVFYAHRQRRWRKLVNEGFSYS